MSNRTERWQATLALRIAVAASLLASVIIFSIGGTTYLFMRKMVETNTKTNMLGSADILAEHISGNINAMYDSLVSMSVSYLKGSAFVDSMEGAGSLAGVLSGANNIKADIIVTDVLGRPSASIKKDSILLPENQWVAEAANNGQERSIVLVKDGQPVLVMAKPIFFATTGTMEGVLVYQLPFKRLLIAHSRYRAIATWPWMSAFYLGYRDPDTNKMKYSGNKAPPTNGPLVYKRLKLPQQLSHLGISLVLAADANAIDKPVNRLLYIYLIVGFILLCLVVVISIIGANRLTRRLKRLQDEASAIAADCGSVTGRFVVEGNDEVSSLSVAFNHMMDLLEKAYKKLERKARQDRELNEERFRTLVTLGPAVIYSRDISDGFPIKFIGNNISQLVGWDSDNFIEDRSFWIDNIHPDDVSGVLEAFGGFITHGRLDHEYRLRRKDGSYGWVHDELKVVYSKDETPHEIIGYLTDISDHKKAEEKVKASLKEKEVLVQEISHRVKNNLQVVSSMLALQASAESDIKIVNALEESNRRVNVMARIHESFCRSDDMPRVNAGDYLGSIIDDVKLSYAGDPREIRFNEKVDDVVFDIDRAISVGQIISELISNTLKHAFPKGKGGSVDVSLRQKGEGSVELIVVDDGVGLPEGLDIEKSTSLGLKLVAALATGLGGKINVDCSRGTKFSMVFERDPS